MSRHAAPQQGGGYQVDVSALEQTVAKLNAVAAELGPTADRAAYRTTIGGGTLGTGFAGATGLLGTHDAMQSWIAEMISQLKSLIEEYGGQAKQVAANYTDLEDQTAQNMFG
ncbi:hypothetical protein [Streptacidiphilus sp. P02-A3a]|uniref:hypothetical protein n=1 Tax=Streptacidiphilus sp. P02-A3a TaxID=2704468 RepID=UPI0015F9BF83|nr:hypothetical protein [Streptacidiphilus sp. P02-A3a]QMU72394.1 hypothetical protein GXP74_33285 [Streptacidiphilus sp. P02-A3a]